MVQSTKSGIASRLGAKGQAAVATHKADETVVGSGGNLPSGIEFGVAELTEIKFGVYAQDIQSKDLRGKDFVYLAGIVHDPKEFELDGRKVKVEGLRTSQTEALCDTPELSRKTMEEHIAWLLNQLRLLGIDTAGKDFKLDNIEEICAELVKGGVFFNFRTWKGSKQTTGKYAGQEPRTQHEWQGACEAPNQEGGESAVKDVSAPATAATKKGTKPTAKAEVDASATDWDALGIGADNAEDEAMSTLNESALELGFTEEEINGVKTWSELAERCKAREAGTEASESADEAEAEATEEEASEVDFDAVGVAADEEYAASSDDTGENCQYLVGLAAENGLEPNDFSTWAELAETLKGLAAGEQEAEWEPKKGELYKYMPPGIGKKKTECEVIVVNIEKKTVTLKSLVDNKTMFPAVAWDKLIQE